MNEKQLKQVREAQEAIRKANRIFLQLTKETGIEEILARRISLAEKTTFDILVENINFIEHDAIHIMFAEQS